MDPDCSKGKIYEMVIDGLCYIGSTIQPLSARKAQHKSRHKQYKSGKTTKRYDSFVLFDIGEPEIKLLEKYPFISDTMQVKIGGTTCFDYTAEGKNKGFFVPKLIETMDWNKDESIYFGDALFPGGNDESVIGVIDTQAVVDPADTLSTLQKVFS